MIRKVPSDNELIQLTKQGDESAYSEIYKRYWGILFQHARKMLQDDESAKDIVQDVFAALWTKRNNLDIHTKLSSYLYGVVRYKIFDFIDRGKVQGSYLQSLEKFIDQGEYTTDNIWLQKELALQIEKETNALPAKMREIFVLSREQDLSYKEIAEQLNISDQTVKKQIYNAMKILRPKFGLYLLILSYLFRF